MNNKITGEATTLIYCLSYGGLVAICYLHSRHLFRQ